MDVKEELAIVLIASLLLAFVVSLAVGFGALSGVASAPFATLSLFVAFGLFAVIFAILGVTIWGLFRLSQRGGGRGRNRRR